MSWSVWVKREVSAGNVGELLESIDWILTSTILEDMASGIDEASIQQSHNVTGGECWDFCDFPCHPQWKPGPNGFWKIDLSQIYSKTWKLAASQTQDNADSLEVLLTQNATSTLLEVGLGWPADLGVPAVWKFFCLAICQADINMAAVDELSVDDGIDQQKQ